MNNKGQSILSEHVMVFFIVVAALVAMTTFVQRGLQARIHDARNFMVNSVNSVCDANCLAATGGKIANEYEPYYAQMLSDQVHNEETNLSATQGNAQVLGAIYFKTSKESTKIISTSVQLPPGCADGANPKPANCP